MAHKTQGAPRYAAEGGGRELVLFSSVYLRSVSATVSGADNIYGAALTSGAPGGGNIPNSWGITPGAWLSFSVSGVVTNDNWGHTNDADGFGSSASESAFSGVRGMSGIKAPNYIYLVGVFLAGTGPPASAPAVLDFVISGTGFTSLQPALSQVFFVGDGLTGHGDGSVQTFVAPAGAERLYLGVVDGFTNWGTPCCYNDNTGLFSVSITHSVEGLPSPPSTYRSASLLLATLNSAVGDASMQVST